MPGNRKQQEAVACALTHETGIERATPELVHEILCAGDQYEVLFLLDEVMSPQQALNALPAVCKAAGINFDPEEVT